MAARFSGYIIDREVDGVPVYRVKLSSYSSEEGFNIEFVGDYLLKQEAEDVIAFWRTGGHDMVRSVSRLRECFHG